MKKPVKRSRSKRPVKDLSAMKSNVKGGLVSVVRRTLTPEGPPIKVLIPEGPPIRQY